MPSLATFTLGLVRDVVQRAAQDFQVNAYREQMFAVRGNPQQVRQGKEAWRARGLDVDSVSLYGG